MKLKKTLSIIMAATLSMFTITGCSAEGKNYSKELSNLAKWEATSTEVNGEMSIDANGVNEKLTFSATGYAKGQTTGHFNIKFNNASGNIKVPNMEMYIDKGVVYMDKDYYVNNFTLNGVEAPKALTNIPSQYIGMDYGMDMNELVKLTKSPNYLSDLATQFFGKDTDLEIPMKQNDREYSINMNSDEMVDLVSKAIVGLSENLDNNNSMFNYGFDKEMIKAIKEGIEDPSFKEMVEQVRPALKGSNLSTKEKFTDDSYTSNINMNLEIANTAKVSLKMNSVSKKAAVKDVVVPISKTVLTQEQFMNMMIPQEAQAQLQGK